MRPLILDMLSIFVALLALIPINALVVAGGLYMGFPEITAINFTLQGIVIGVIVAPPLFMLCRRLSVFDPLVLMVCLIAVVAVVIGTKGVMCMAIPDETAPYRINFESHSSINAQCIYFALLNFAGALPKGFIVLVLFFQIRKLIERLLFQSAGAS